MAQDTAVKTSMYAVMGAPAQLISTLRKGISTARGGFDDMRDQFTDEVGFAFGQGADEGGRLVEMLGYELSSRRAAVGRVVRTRTGTVRDVRPGFAARTDTPDPVDAIDGIGPKYSEKLARAGVLTAGTLIERCRTQSAVDALAEQTGISAGLLRRWSHSADLTRIDGAGTHMMAMLNGRGIATAHHRAQADASELRRRARGRAVDPLSASGVGSSVPSGATPAGWIREASVKVG